MKITIPTNRNWQVSYFGDLFSNVVDTQSVDFHYSQGKIRTGNYLFGPHTVTTYVAAIQPASQFVLSNADNSSGTLKYWAACEKLYKVPYANLNSTVFVADTITLSPTALVDSDLVKWGVTESSPARPSYDGIDILVCSTPTDLSILDYAMTGTFVWINNWWSSDLLDTFATTTVSGPAYVALVVASTGVYNNNDVISITNVETQYAQYTGNVTTTIHSNLISSTIYNLQTMAPGSAITGTNIPANTYITTNPNFGQTVIVGSAYISNNATGSGSVSETWSDMIPLNINGTYTVTVSGSVVVLNGPKVVNAFGTSLNVTYSGNVERIFNNSTRYYYLGQVPLVAGVPHILLPFGIAPLLFITDGNQVHSIASPGEYSSNLAQSLPQPSDVQYARLVFKPGYTINWACATSLKIYFGLYDNRQKGMTSLVEEYDPFNEQVREIEIQNGATIGFVNDNNVWIIDYIGNLKSFNGMTFDTVAQFPTVQVYDNSFGLPHRNGIYITQDRIHMLVNNAPDYFCWCPDGLWTYELNTKRLYHEGSPFASTTSATEFGNTFGDVYKALYPGAGYGDMLAGLETWLEFSVSQSGIFSNPPPAYRSPGTPSSGRGRITLGKIPSSEIDTVYRNILIKYDPFLLNGGLKTGTIVVKYKTEEYRFYGLNQQGTWINATSFTASSPSNLVIGAEMTVTQGQASGASFHIVKVVGTTVTITNEDIGFVPSGLFMFNMDNFYRFPNSKDITDNTRNWKLLDIPDEAIGEWIQFKIEIRGGFSLEEVQVGVAPNRQIEPTQAGGQMQ